MRYTYAFLGKARTGTTSMWRMYRDHPQVAPSKEKDYLFSHQNVEEYIDKGFIIDKHTKVLLEGTNDFDPQNIHLLSKVKELKEIGRMCCIYSLREPKERLISAFNLINKMRGNPNYGRPQSFHFEDGSLDYRQLKLRVLFNVHQYRYLENIESIIGKDNILVVKLEEIKEKQEKIHEFLEIDNIKLIFPKRNATTEVTPTIEHIRMKSEIIKFMDDFYEKVSSISDEQTELIHERYNVI